MIESSVFLRACRATTYLGVRAWNGKNLDGSSLLHKPTPGERLTDDAEKFFAASPAETIPIFRIHGEHPTPGLGDNTGNWSAAYILRDTFRILAYQDKLTAVVTEHLRIFHHPDHIVTRLELMEVTRDQLLRHAENSIWPEQLGLVAPTCVHYSTTTPFSLD